MKFPTSPNACKSVLTSFCVWVLLSSVSLAAPYLAVNGASHDYLTLHYYIDEPGDSESLTVEFWPNEGNVAEAQIWSNLNRRDYATLDAQDASGVPGPSPAGDGYFVGFPLNDVGGGKWEATFPINKTGAYRITARYRLNGEDSWKWVGGRDTAVMVSPKKARDVILYELQVNVINATGDTEGTRSTFEDFLDPTKPANLDYFENLGVNTLWIQPIHPIGDHHCVDKSEGPGSPYSIKNMWEVAPFMSQANTRPAAMQAFQDFAEAAGERGIDFFFDIIFNHTSWDAEIGRDPDDPTQPAADPSAEIRDILPQWYSRFVGSGNPCDEYAYNQDDFHYWLPASNAGQIGVAPAERNDFGKWPDVADLFWGTYPSLFDVQTEDDTWWDTSQPGADVRRMTEYFAYFGEYWIEKSGGTLGGFRCDYAQGLPPQAWEYFVNRIRQVKWDFIFMAESLDGGPVSQRAGRHMDIINQNWVWQVLGAGGNTSGLRGIIDENKQDYGFAGIMRGIVNHDQNAPEDRWYTFSRYAVGAVVDGAPQLYQGQELGYENNWGFSRFRFQFSRWIPDIFKWHNMQPLWNNRDSVLEAAYARVNHGRLRSLTTRLHDQWYLDRVGGEGPDQNIFSVLKYDQFGWDPAHQNVVMNFVNLTPWTQQTATFDLASVEAIGIDPERYYNIRALTLDDPNVQLWDAPGRTGQDLLDNGIWVNFPADGNQYPEWAFVQMLVLEEHGTTPGPGTGTAWTDPAAPEGCDPVTIHFDPADGPLSSARTVYLFVGRNDWLDVQNVAMTESDGVWSFTYNPPAGTEVINFVFNDGNPDPDQRVWDNNDWQDWSVNVANCAPGGPAVWTDPAEPEGCDPITVYYDPQGRILVAADPVYIHIGRNGWQDVIEPNPAMSESGGVWSYTYTPAPGTEEINFVFNDGAGVWDNNGGADWHVSVDDCEGAPPPPTGLVITNPPSSIVVSHETDTYTLQGIAENIAGSVAWTNTLTGDAGSFAAATPWSLADVALGVGENVITVSGTTELAPTLITNAIDNAGNYGGGWTDSSNEGSGFGAWTLESDGMAGHFVGGNGFGLWSHEGDNFAAAVRPFPAAMSVGQTFHVRMQNGWIWEDGGSVGVALRDGSGDEKWLLYFVGGEPTYSTGDGATDIDWTDAGLDIAFTLTGANAYSVDVTPVGGATRTYTGTFTGQLTEMRAWSANNGTDDEFNPNRDFFFDNLLLTEEGSGGGVPVSSSRTITRLDDDGDTDSNGDGVPDWWYDLHGFNPGIPNLAAQPGPNGYPLGASFLMQLDPNDTSAIPMLMRGLDPDTKEVLWQAMGGRRYVVEYRNDGDPEWHTLSVEDLAANGAASSEDADMLEQDSRTYRIRFMEVID